jgi:hypothetical protein
MLKVRNSWIAISLINLSIVALLGVLLRSKILFSIPWIDFKFILHAHSHFAFAGWLTLCLFTLLTYDILPRTDSNTPKYKYLLSALLLTSAGMLLSFPFQGYGLFSIIFSTLFIFVTYAFSWVFIKDLLKSEVEKSIKLLCIVALTALCISSVGPFTLAYMMASHSVNILLYRDAIYTYLHLQYNGFFSLSVFALLINQFNIKFDGRSRLLVKRFATVLSLSVLPTLFLSYLWHFPNMVIRGIAILGCVLLVVALYRFGVAIKSTKPVFSKMNPLAKIIGGLSLFAFALKTILQIGTVFPAIGDEVFSNRAVIIGYLHLVMLGFISLYLLAYLVHTKYFEIGTRPAKTGIIVFTVAVIANEIILMTQGLSEMMMKNSPIYPWLLWGAAIGLFIGTLLINISAATYRKIRITSKSEFSPVNAINF